DADSDELRPRPRARVRRAAPRRRGAPLLLLADPRHRIVLDRGDVVPLRALRGHVPGRALADRRLSGLAALLDDVSRADRVRRHGAGAGDDGAAAVADGRDPPELRRRALRVHALVLALWSAAVLRGVGVGRRPGDAALTSTLRPAWRRRRSRGRSRPRHAS